MRKFLGHRKLFGFSVLVFTVGLLLNVQLYSQQFVGGDHPLINVDFSGADGASPKVGLAAVGQATNDFWNFYTRNDGHGGWLTSGAVSNLKLADGTVTSAGLTVLNAPGSWGNGSSDPMYDGYIYPFDGDATISRSNLPAGQYDLYLYANDGNYQVTVGNTDYGVKTAQDDPVSNPPVWQEGRQYARFGNVEVSAGQAVTITVQPGVYGYAIISGLQVVQSSTVVTSSPPVIVKQPAGQTVSAGANAEFSVTATGSGTLSYQWRLDGADVEGATTSVLALEDVQVEDEGTYSVRVTNSFGSVVSADAALVVAQAASNVLINVDFGAGGPSAKVGLAAVGQTTHDFWNFYDRNDGQGGWLTSGSVSNLKLTDATVTSAGMTVLNAPGAWGNGSSDPMYDGYIYPFTGNATITLTNLPAGRYDLYLYANDGNYQVSVGDTDYGIKTAKDVPVNSPPEWQEGRQYARFGNLNVSGDQALTITVRPGVYGYAIISGLQIAESSSSVTGSPPSILAQPTGNTVLAGANVEFSVTATGSGTLSYQWRLNGVDVAGATSSVLALNNVQADVAGQYSVRITNDLGSANSANAALVIIQPVSSAPINVDFGAGGPSAKVGLAAVGQTTNDFWNFYDRNDGEGGWLTSGAVSNLSLADGTVTGAGLTVLNAPGAWGNGSSDPMYDGYIYPFEGNATISLTNLPAGQYDLYLYANDGNYKVVAGDTDYGVKTAQDVSVTSPAVWQEGRQYARFGNVNVSGGQALTVTVRPGIYGYAIISGLQVVQSSAVVTNSPPVIVAHSEETVSKLSKTLSRRKDGRLRMQFVIPTGTPPAIEASTNLVDWEVIGVAVDRGFGSFEFEDPAAKKFSARFYRIASP